jgi:hypothetical protein
VCWDFGGLDGRNKTARIASFAKTTIDPARISIEKALARLSIDERSHFRGRHALIS